MNKSDNDSDLLLIQNQYFLTETSLRQYIKWDALPGLAFKNCHFEKVYFQGKVLGSCRFTKCTWNDFNARKGTVSGCRRL
jgi:hypothetical protein